MLAATAPLPSGAQTVYRSVDESGNVTFSERPAPGAREVERVTMPPTPSAEQQAESREEAERVGSEAERMAAERRQREAAARDAAPRGR